MSELIGKNIAETEVNAWLDFQGITAAQKIVFAPTIVRLVEAVQDGTLTIDSATNSLTQKLKFPFGKEAKVIKLTYKPRLTVGEIDDAKSKISEESSLRNTFAHLMAATCEPIAVLTLMDNKDFKLCDAIILFFMM